MAKTSAPKTLISATVALEPLYKNVVAGPKVDTAASPGFVPVVRSSIIREPFKTKHSEVIVLLADGKQKNIIEIIDEDDNDLMQKTRKESFSKEAKKTFGRIK